MAAYYGYGGQQGFTPVNTALSRRFGDTPGGTGGPEHAGMFSFKGDGGRDQYFLPDRYKAGNLWSSASPNADYIKSIGGREYTTPTGSTTTTNTSNPWGQNFNSPVTENWGGQKGWVFDQMPDWAKIEENSNFLGGRGTSNRSFNEGLLALAAAVTGGSSLAGMGGGASASGGTTAISGGGSLATSAPTAGGALATGGGGAAGAGGAMNLSGSIPSMAGSSTMGGSGVGAFGGAGTLSGAGAATTGASGFAGLGEALSSGASWLKGNVGLPGALGIADLGLRIRQGNQLEDIANRAADRSDALSQPKRFPYQNLLGEYMLGGKSIAEQPYVKANMDFALDQARANMARTGKSGGGGAEREIIDYTNKAFEASALPYLQQLSGNAGFGFGPGNAGSVYGQYASGATAAPIVGLNDLARAFGYGQGSPSWQGRAYNSQQQMFGDGPGRSWTIS